MSKSRFNRNNGPNNHWRPWRASGQIVAPKFTRQMKHLALFRKTWALMSGDKALATVQGIIPRRVRRDMARTLSKRNPNLERK